MLTIFFDNKKYSVIQTENMPNDLYEAIKKYI
jgi:hypothetical protein